jgi:hypothetical protein
LILFFEKATKINPSFISAPDTGGLHRGFSVAFVVEFVPRQVYTLSYFCPNTADKRRRANAPKNPVNTTLSGKKCKLINGYGQNEVTTHAETD